MPAKHKKSLARRIRKALTFDRVLALLSVVVPVVVAVIDSRRERE